MYFFRTWSLWCLLALTAHSQEAADLQRRFVEEWRWREISSPGASSSLSCIAAHPAGGLLGAHRSGIARYNGYCWTEIGQFQWPKEFTPNQLEPLLDGACVVSEGDAFVFAKDGSVQRLSPETTAPTFLTQLSHSPNGDVFFGCERWLYRVTAEGAARWRPSPDGQQISGASYEAPDRFWCVTTGGAYLLSDGEWQQIDWLDSPEPIQTRYFIQSSGDQTYFLSNTSNPDCAVRRYDGLKLHEVPQLGGEFKFRAVVPCLSNSLLVAAHPSALRIIGPENNTEVFPRMLSGERVLSLEHTREGHLAVVTASGRLLVCELNSQRWQAFRMKLDGRDWNSVNVIQPAQQGGLWLGTSGGITHFEDGEFQYHESAADLPLRNVTALMEDEQGNLWIGSGSGFTGLVRRDPEGHWHRHQEEDGVGNRLVHAIRRTPDHGLWFLLLGWQQHEGGLVRLQGERWYRHRLPNDMLPPRCYDVTQDPSGRVYVATYFGVHLLQADGLALLPNQTNNNNTFSLLATRDGTVYSGRGFDLNGLRVFRDGAVAPLPSLELNNLAAGAMVETQDGKLWLTSRSGLFLFDGLSCSEISGEEGIPGRSFWPILDTQDGDLWLGGLGSGLIRLRRDDFEPPQTSNLSVDYSPSSERWVARWEACDAWNRTTPDRLRFIVQVDDEPWSQPFRGQEYWLPANLDYGRHQIRVQAVDDFGNLEAAPPSAAIQVPVPAYAQPQVLAAAGALFGALLLLASATIQRGRALRRQERRQRTELAASESHYRSLVEHAQMVLAHFDARGRLEYLSPKALDLTGFTVEEFMVDRKLFDRRTHSQYLETLKEFQHRRENGIQEPLEGEVRWRHRDGTWRWLHTRQEPRLNKAGELLGFDSITVDVTATRRAEAAMRETQKLESLGMLAGGIAHDFNNLLVGILGNADLLRESSRYDPMLRDALDDIEEASRQASELCQQMLAYAGRAGLEKTAVDLSALTEEVLNLLPAQWGHSLALDIDLAVGLPALVGDAVQIRQVIMNLVLNAREALQEPGGNIAIRTGVTDLTADRLRDCVVGHDQSPGRYVYISVHDDGVGMDEEVRMRIFDPFYTTKFKGRGLGLAAVLGIIRGHRGVLELETAVGSGTRFVVYWPASNRPTPSRPSRHPLEPFRGQGTVLVIDDEEVVRRVAERMLGMLGFSVLTATNGREGIRMFQSHQNEIRAVLLDVTMPDLDGTEVLQNLKEQKADLPVLLSSGYSEKETLERLTAEVLRNNSRTAFLPKPWDLSLLRRRLQQLLRETTTFSPES